MKKIFKLLLIVLAFITVINVKADATIDFSKKGSMEITLVDSDTHSPVIGTEVKITKIADATVVNSNLAYKFVTELEPSGISLKDLTDTTLITKITKYIEDNNINLEGNTYTTNNSGKLNASNLDLGLYLINQVNELEGYSSFNPYLVTIPTFIDSEWIYDLDSKPKTEILKLTDLTIKKVWVINDTNHSTTPIEVALLLDGVEIDKVILNKDNNWEYTYKRIRQYDTYSIREINVPKDFKDTYNNEGFIFTVTNTDELPKTGTLIYLVPIIATLGIAFIVAGIYVNKKELISE